MKIPALAVRCPNKQCPALTKNPALAIHSSKLDGCQDQLS